MSASGHCSPNPREPFPVNAFHFQINQKPVILPCIAGELKDARPKPQTLGRMATFVGRQYKVIIGGATPNHHMTKVTRIAYNSADWYRPTGDARNYETPGTYNHEHGFGHEDWLFRDQWQIDGWRYAFIEGVNKSHRRLVKARETIDLTLFTIEPDKRRRYVASIRALECLTDEQAADALKLFKKLGWFSTMLDEIQAIGGNAAALGNNRWAKHILNVRFRLENLARFAPGTFASQGDPIRGFPRYMLYNLPEAAPLPGRPKRRAQREDSSLQPFSRGGTAPTVCTPEHARMQAQLFTELQSEFPGARIVREEDFVDISVHNGKELLLYEIKSDLQPRAVIREALGQILEYAFYRDRKQDYPIRLVIVGRCAPEAADQQYLEHLRNSFSLPVEYRTVSL